MRTVLCAVDDSQGAAAALRVAANLSDVLELRLVVVHVVEDVALSPPARREARAGGQRLVDRVLGENGVHSAEWRVALGDPAREIAEIATYEAPTLVVIGSELSGRRWRPPLRSRLATELARISPAPVVVVPPVTTRSAHLVAPGVARSSSTTGDGQES